MYFSLFDFGFRKEIKQISFLTFSFMPKEDGTRHLLCFRLVNEEDDKLKKIIFSIHWLWNWNKAFVKEVKK